MLTVLCPLSNYHSSLTIQGMTSATKELTGDIGPRLLTREQAAKFTGLQPKTLDNWRSAGKGPKWRKLGGSIRYSIDDLIFLGQFMPFRWRDDCMSWTDGGRAATAVEIVSRARISDVWVALGGDQPKRGRAPAFYRDGDNPEAVSLDDRRGVWYDYRDNVGGGVLALIQRVRCCRSREALHWLACHFGISVPRDTPPGIRRQWQREGDERRAAHWWGIGAAALAEEALSDERLLNRADMTRLLGIVRTGGAVLLAEYRAWRVALPAMTRALTWAGRRSEVRIQRLLAEYIAGVVT